MSYCIDQDLINRFGTQELVRLTNIDNISATTINDAVLNVAIADADAVINDYLCDYLPLPAVPARLVREACNIVRYFLYKDTPTVLVEKNYHDALEYLRRIDLDQMGIGADDTGTPVIDISDSVSFTKGYSAFGRGQLRDYVRDDDEPFGLGRM